MKKHSSLEYIKLIYSLDKRLYLVTIIDIISNLFYSVIPVGIINYLGGIYQTNSTSEGFKYVLLMCGGYTLLRLIISGVDLFCYNVLSDRALRRLSNALLQQLYKKIDEVDYDTYQSNDFLNSYQKIVSDGPDNMMNCFWNTLSFVSNLFSLIGVSSILIILNPLTIVYAIIISIISTVISFVVARINHKLSDANMQHVRERGYIKRIFFLKDSSIDVKTSGITPMYLKKNNQIGDKIIKNLDKYMIKTRGLTSLDLLLTSSISIVTLSFAAYTAINQNNMVLLASLITASNTFSNLLSSLTSTFGMLKEALTYKEDYYRVMDVQCEIENTGKTYEEMSEFKEIKFNNVSFNYPNNEKNSLTNINLTIQKNQKIAIVGENGAGKTTFVKLLLRLYDTNSGVITYNNINYQDILPKFLRSKFVTVFQNYQIFATSIGENILMRKLKTKEDEEIVFDALKKVGLYDKVKELENGIYTNCTKEFDKKGLELSGGERQKLVIARIFASPAEILLLDEPNSALDPLAEKKIFDEIFKYSVSKTLIFISHRFSTTINADKIYLFDNGEIVEEGMHHELMEKDGHYKKMFLVQAEEYRKTGEENEKC